MIYIREAHPTDGWQMESNITAGVEYATHQSDAERHQVASACAVGLRLSIPVLVDEFDNRMDIAFNAWPERLYVLARNGEVLYQGGKGPYGFDPDDLEQFLLKLAGF